MNIYEYINGVENEKPLDRTGDFSQVGFIGTDLYYMVEE